MNPLRSSIRYAAPRSCLRGIALFALLAGRNAWAQPAPGDDENVLPEDAPPQSETEAASPEPEPEQEPRELPRKAKKPPAPKVLRSRARVERAKAEAEAAAAAAAATEAPGAVRLHLETPVPAALYDVSTGDVPSGKEPPDSQLVCHSPCDALVDVSEGQRFAVWAPQQELSKPFTVGEDAREVTVTFEPAPSTLNDVGVTIGVVGLTFFILGGSVLLYGVEKGNLSDGVLGGGGVMLGGGTALILIGTPMLLAARNPDITVQEKPAGEAFAIDRRPQARAPRPWLGEF